MFPASIILCIVEFTNIDIICALKQIIPFSALNLKPIKEIQTLLLSGQIRLASELPV
jgi:hypothetical protein